MSCPSILRNLKLPPPLPPLKGATGVERAVQRQSQLAPVSVTSLDVPGGEEEEEKVMCKEAHIIRMPMQIHMLWIDSDVVLHDFRVLRIIMCVLANQTQEDAQD